MDSADNKLNLVVAAGSQNESESPENPRDIDQPPNKSADQSRVSHDCNSRKASPVSNSFRLTKIKTKEEGIMLVKKLGEDIKKLGLLSPDNNMSIGQHGDLYADQALILTDCWLQMRDLGMIEDDPFMEQMHDLQESLTLAYIAKVKQYNGKPRTPQRKIIDPQTTDKLTTSQKTMINKAQALLDRVHPTMISLIVQANTRTDWSAVQRQAVQLEVASIIGDISKTLDNVTVTIQAMRKKGVDTSIFDKVRTALSHKYIELQQIRDIALKPKTNV